MIRIFRQYCLLICYSLLIASLFLSCSKKEEAKQLVKIGDKGITVDEFVHAVPPDLWNCLSNEDKNIMLAQIIDQELLVQEVEKNNLDQLPEIQSKLISARREIFEQVFNDMIVEPRISISPEEIREFYRKNQMLFVRDNDMISLQKLIVNSESKIDSIDDALKSDNNNDLKTLAENLTLDTNGIDLGYIPTIDIKSSLRKKILAEGEGEIIRDKINDSTVSYLKIMDIAQKGTLRSEESVRAQIENIIFNQKREKIYRQILDSLTNLSEPQIDSEMLDSLTFEMQ